MTGPVSVIHEPGLDAAFGLLKGQVCSNFSQEEVERRLAKEYPGTRHGWQITGKTTRCRERKGYTHYSVAC